MIKELRKLHLTNVQIIKGLEAEILKNRLDFKAMTNSYENTIIEMATINRIEKLLVREEVTQKWRKKVIVSIVLTAALIAAGGFASKLIAFEPYVVRW